jgi:hypothetical protein
MNENQNKILADRTPIPDLLTEQELVQFLRIPYVSKSTDYSNVVKNLIRFRDLPRVKICNKLLYPRQAVLKWVENETIPK